MENTQAARDLQNDDINRAILISIGAHMLLFIVLFVRAVLYPPSDSMHLEDTIRVDIVALPDKGLPKSVLPPPPQPAPAKPEPPKPVPKPVKPVEAPKPVVIPKPAPDKPTFNPKKAHKDEEAAIKRIEALEKINNMMKDDKANNTKVQPQPQIKGNQVSQGSALKGLARMEHDSYLQTAQAYVKGHWNLPQWMTSANLSARVRIYVDSRGNVVKKVLTRSSGKDMYDARVMAAIEEASPLPAPPSDLANALSVDGLEVEFTPD